MKVLACPHAGDRRTGWSRLSKGEALRRCESRKQNRRNRIQDNRVSGWRAQCDSRSGLRARRWESAQPAREEVRLGLSAADHLDRLSAVDQLSIETFDVSMLHEPDASLFVIAGDQKWLRR